MKTTLMLGLLLTLITGCGHSKNNQNQKNNEAAISFSENEQQFNAELQFPKTNQEKFPLVVIIHEWWGRTPYIMGRSQMLNDEGYATVAIDLYGDGKTVETPSEAQALATPFYQDPQLAIGRLNKYLVQAKNHPKVDSNRIYVIGYCFGGTQALNYARSGADIKGVVSFHGGLTSSLKANSINAKILAINGLADPMVPAKDRAAFEQEMKKAQADFKVINYKGATHAFTNPKATEVGKKYNIPIAYNEKADMGSWQDLLKFLK